MHVCLGGLALELQSRRLLTNRIVKPLVRDNCKFLWTNHSAACSNRKNTYLRPVILPQH